METVSVIFSVDPEETIAIELLIYELQEIGYEGFVEEQELIEAYIAADIFNIQLLDILLQQEQFSSIRISSVNKHQEQNWNAIWEASYGDVVINKRCRVRAPFHEARPDIDFDLLIEPRMSFGTAHHETTHMMIELLLDANLTGKSLIDMGCGTAVLAILARKLGAKPVIAIDNDNWAVSNAKDNIRLNNTEDVEIIAGDALQLKQFRADFLLANINRNILLSDISVYVNSLSHSGTLMMSGFYLEDLILIKEKCIGLGLSFNRHLTRNNWCAAIFDKP